MKRGYSESSSTSLEPPQSRFKHNPENDLLEDEGTNIFARKVAEHYSDQTLEEGEISQTMEVAEHYSDQTLEEGEISPTMEAQPQETPTVHMNAVKQSLLQTESTSKEPSLDEVEEIIRYNFRNKKLLEEAFTHSSFTCGFSYERLEYVGDGVLGLLFCQAHYSLYPDLAPGKLTLLRAANVDTEKLARVALRHGFHRYLRHRKPYLVDQIQEFSRAVIEYPLHSNGLIDAPKDLADVVESTIGAVFMDCNSIEVVWHVFKGLLEPIITQETIQIHPNTQLLEMCQKNRRSLKYVDSWEKDYSVGCVIDGQIVGRGTYSLRKDVALNRAAKDALDNRWKWMENNATAIAQRVTEEPSEPVLLKNMNMENRDEDAISSVEQAEEPSVGSLVPVTPGKKDMQEDLETNDTSVRGPNVLSEETTSYNETNFSTRPRGQIEMHAINSLLGNGIGDEFIGLSRGQRKRLRKRQRKISANTTIITPETIPLHSNFKHTVS
ncbi:endoribonuclease Dicer homolog 1-like [Rosa rugosa]|uniref:endoribonuclease Dicer homolog 1-like n=1 Tax=Rosa rugosa TaxID=74645 RepID=UPI002B404603|nr:endoribonuclease Dicer homolog 1-like [Rosa rugosa]